MFEVSTILEDDSVELVSEEANGLVKVSLTWRGSLFAYRSRRRRLPTVSGGGRVAAEMGLDAALGFLKYSSNIG
ncbi:hypothetical protein Tco_1304323 [Tanacetum coccineum]